MSTFVGTRTDGLADIDAVLVQEANRIGDDIHAENVHVSPWLDLVPKGTFPEGMGYRLQSLIYERALPTNAAGDALGLTWGDFAGADGFASGNTHSTSWAAGGTGVSGTAGLLNDSVSDFHGPLANDAIGAAAATGPSRIDWQKRLEPYQLKRATVWSPEINVDDLRFAAHRTEQLSAAFDALAEGVRYGWEERYRDEYKRVVHHIVECTATTALNLTELAAGAGTAADRFDNGIPGTVVNISNAIMDRIRNAMIRAGAGKQAWGRSNNQPIFGLVCSSECSYTLMTESDIRTDIRESSTVDDLLAPLGVDRPFRGWFHLIDDLAPRYGTASSDAGYSDGDYIRVEPYSLTAGLILPNSAYEAAATKYEVAIVLHKEVMQSLIPSPVSGSNGLSFDPVDYSGKFHWINIKSVDLNPLGTVGNFLGVLASATKPLKTRFGYAIIYDRLSGTAAT